MEVPIWNKFAVGMLAVATVAAARVLLRRLRQVEVPTIEAGEYRDVEDLYAAGL